jgi:hypothetical protein
LPGAASTAAPGHLGARGGAVKPEIEALLGGYSAGTLSKDEQRQLFEAAADDQEVFDALAAEQPLRELLSQPAYRRELLETLETTSLKGRFVAWMTRPGPWLAAAAATVAAVAGVLWLRPVPPQPVPGLTPSPTLPGITLITRPSGTDGAELLRRLFALPARQAFEVDLHLDRSGEPPRYRIADRLRVGFKIEEESNILLLEKRADGTVVQLFPSASAPFPRAKAGVQYWVPLLSDPALLISPPAGPRAIRLIAFPTNTDPLSISVPQLELVRRGLTILERTYVVVE